MQRDVLFRQYLAKTATVVEEVLLIQERGSAVDAAMGNMKRQSGYFEARSARHGVGWVDR